MQRLLSVLMLFCFASCMLEGPSPTVPRSDYLKLIEKGVVYLRESDANFLSKAEFNRDALKRAEAMFIMAERLRPADPEAADGIGAVQLRFGAKDVALMYFHKAISLDPAYARGYVHLAYLSELEGRLEESRMYLGKALELSPVDTHALNNLGALIVDNPKLNIGREVGEMYILQSEELGRKK